MNLPRLINYSEREISYTESLTTLKSIATDDMNAQDEDDDKEPNYEMSFLDYLRIRFKSCTFCFCSPFLRLPRISEIPKISRQLSINLSDNFVKNLRDITRTLSCHNYTCPCGITGVLSKINKNLQ